MEGVTTEEGQTEERERSGNIGRGVQRGKTHKKGDGGERKGVREDKEREGGGRRGRIKSSNHCYLLIYPINAFLCGYRTHGVKYLLFLSSPFSCKHRTLHLANVPKKHLK